MSSLPAPGNGDGPEPGPCAPSPGAEPFLLGAHRLVEEGDWQGAATLLRTALEEHADDPFLLCALAVAERELGFDGVAYELFRACLAAAPQDPQVLATAGTGVAALDDPDAEPALRTAAMLAPDLASVRCSYGAYLSREGYLEEALRELQAARQLDPSDASVSYELGVALALADNAEGAVDELYRAAELDPEDGWVRVVLGLALLEEDRPGEAMVEFAAGARERPGDVEAQLLAALTAAGQDEEDLAWEMLERARMVAEGEEAALTEAVEELLEEGAESARRFLLSELSPGSYRRRLRRRP